MLIYTPQEGTVRIGSERPSAWRTLGTGWPVLMGFAILLTSVVPAHARSVQLPISVQSFGLLGGSVSNTGTSVIGGNVGATSTISGFPPGTATGFVCTPTSDAPCTAEDNTAVTAAYNSIFGEGGVFLTAQGLTSTGLITTDSSQTFLRNTVYASSGNISTITGTSLFFDAQGDADSEFILKIAGDLTVNGALTFTLQNGAQAANIFWIVQNAAVISVGTLGPITFDGNILAGSSFTMSAAAGGSGALAGTINGCVFADTANTLAGYTNVNGCAETQVATPEPGTWYLLCAGLVGLDVKLRHARRVRRRILAWSEDD